MAMLLSSSSTDHQHGRPPPGRHSHSASPKLDGVSPKAPFPRAHTPRRRTPPHTPSAIFSTSVDEGFRGPRRLSDTLLNCCDLSFLLLLSAMSRPTLPCPLLASSRTLARTRPRPLERPPSLIQSRTWTSPPGQLRLSHVCHPSLSPTPTILGRPR